MGPMLTLIKKEFKTYFILPIAYIFISVYLIINNWIYFKGLFIQQQADLRPFFNLQPILLLFFVPALTMRLWAEEKKQGTFQYLMTLPTKKYFFVLGKFFAAWLFMIFTILLTFNIPITVELLGNLDWGVVIPSYLGLILASGAYIAIGIFASSITNNQIIAFILGIAISFAVWVIGEQFVIVTLPSFFANLFSYLGLGFHFRSIQRGVIDLRDVIYYLSVIVLFCYLNYFVIKSKDWE